MCHVTPQENFWVTDHGKVASIKCHNEQKFSAIIYLYDLHRNSLLVKRQIDNPSPGAVTGGN